MPPKGKDASADISFYGEINGREIVASGSVVSRSGGEIVICPFADDRAYSIAISVAFSNTADPSVDLVDIEAEKRRVKILFRQRFKSGEFFSNTEPLAVAMTEDEAYEYLANFAINAFGEEQQYTLLLYYTIFKAKAV
ncbi:hypothetical protein V1294_005038 [Bradyrhizobium sp. AZCC 1678]|uniref:hypothetical protein n=1 Tax=Bradyrhizobium sp. AZCC 1678 TaxID=3117030 RepID=UPI002FEFED55